jgi:hypothetical protein
MKKKYYLVCEHCEKREAEFIFLNVFDYWWDNRPSFPVCRKCRLYEKLKRMGERVSSRIAMYTIKQIRYIGMEDKDEHVITVQENKKIYKVKGTVKRIMKEKNGKRRSK